MIKPSLKLNFARSHKLDPRINYTRTGVGTYLGNDVLVKYAAPNVPRFEHLSGTGESIGMLIESSRTNLLSYTEDLTAGSWTKRGTATVTTQPLIAPDGSSRVSYLQGVVAHTTGDVFQAVAGATPGQRYEPSFWIKRADPPGILHVAHTDGSGYGEWTINTTTLSTAWIKVNRYTTGVTILTEFVGSPGGGIGLHFYGSGTAITFSLWGLQIEAGDFPTSYVPSTNTFTSRASVATYFNSAGVITTAPINAARYDYSPSNLTIQPKLLLEPAATNNVGWSIPTNTNWTSHTNVGVESYGIALDGTQTTYKTEGATGAYRYAITAVTPGTRYTAGIYIKSDRNTPVQLYFDGNNGSYTAFFVTWPNTDSAPTIYDSSGYQASDARIERINADWIRASVSFTAVTGGTYITFQMNTNTTLKQEWWGAQLEAGNTLTSYIPSLVGVQTTRAADVGNSSASVRGGDNLMIFGTSFSNWFSQNKGTIVFDYYKANYQTTGNGSYLGMLTNTQSTSATERYSMAINISSYLNLTSVVGNVIGISASTFAQPATSVSKAGKNRAAYTLSPGAYSLCINDAVGTSDTWLYTADVKMMTIGSDMAYANHFNGVISQIIFYPEALTQKQILNIV